MMERKFEPKPEIFTLPYVDKETGTWAGGSIVCAADIAEWMENSTQSSLVMLDDVSSPWGFVNKCVQRIVTGDWGEFPDPSANDLAVINGERVMGVYKIPKHIDRGVNRHGQSKSKIWLIIEASRDVLTVLFPGE